MFKFFETLVDPFAPFDEATPPKTLWPHLKTHLGPFRWVMFWMAFAGVLVANVETGLIFYTGRVVDLMNATGAEAFWWMICLPKGYGCDRALPMASVCIRLSLDMALANLPEKGAVLFLILR